MGSQEAIAALALRPSLGVRGVARLVVNFATAWAILVGALVLVGWTFNLEPLISVYPGLPRMVPNTGVVFILCGTSLWLVHRPSRQLRRAGNLIVLAVLIFAIVNLIEWLIGMDLGIDQILFPGARATPEAAPGRPAPFTGCMFAALALSLLLTHVHFNHGWRPADPLAILVIVTGILVLSGYVYGAHMLYSTRAPYTATSVHAALTFVVLGVGQLLALPDVGVASIVASRRPGSAAARPLLLIAFTLPVIGLVALLAQRAGYLSQPTTAALLAMTGFLVSVPTLLIISRSMNRMDEAQEQQRQILEMIAQAVPLPKVLDELMRNLEKQAPDMLGSVLLMSDDGQHLVHCAGPSLPDGYNQAVDGMAIGPAAGSCGTAAFLGKPVVVTDIARDPLWADHAESARAAGLKACWSTPICSQRGDVLGTLAIYYRDAVGPSPLHERLVAGATHIARIAAERNADERERQKLVNQISAERRRLASILEQLPVGVVVADRDGRLVMANPEVDTIFRRPFIPTQGIDEYRHWNILHLDGSTYEPHDMPLARSLERGLEIAGEDVRITRGDGTTAIITVSSAPIREGEASVAGGVAVFSDITERRLAEQEMERLVVELQRAVRARDDFLSIASHELRTPVTSLKLQTQILEEILPTQKLVFDDARQRIALMIRQIRRLERLIGELLDVARIDAGKLPLHLELTDLGELTREVSERFRGELAQQRGAPLTLELTADVRGLWDRSRLDQVVTNLITNALKYGLGKSVVITVDRDQDRARLRVQDFGIGIRPEDQKRIFERFERGVSSRNYGGLGLGLWISRQIVESLGGTISVRSELDVGSTFTVELPLEHTSSSRGPEV